MSAPAAQLVEAGAGAAQRVAEPDHRKLGCEPCGLGAQYATTLKGATTRNGAAPGFCWRAWQINASDWTVLPRPMSSARCRRARVHAGSPARRTRRPGTASAEHARWLGAPPVSDPAARAARRPGRRHSSACRITTPSSASSSNEPTWNRLIQLGRLQHRSARGLPRSASV